MLLVLKTISSYQPTLKLLRTVTTKSFCVAYTVQLTTLADTVLYLLQIDKSSPCFDQSYSFQLQFYRKTVDFSGIQTRIVGAEGETSTTALTLDRNLTSRRLDVSRMRKKFKDPKRCTSQLKYIYELN